MSRPIEVVVEATAKRVFASAIDWPGWARSAKTEELAVEALVEYRDRYAAVISAAHIASPPVTAMPDVVERLEGDATTTFGAPGAIATADRRPTDADDARRLRRVVEAAWDAFDAIAAAAPAELRKGPRGGGRDTAKIVAHVLDAELAYASRVGLKVHASPDDLASVSAARRGLAELIGTVSDGQLVGKWPIRYAARRIAWHVLDHAWEIEDRSPGR